MHGKAQSGTERAAAARNIESILRIEKEDAEKLLLHHRALHAVGRFVGTPYFFVVQCVGVASGSSSNTHSSAEGLRFDEYPFPLLAVILGLPRVSSPRLADSSQWSSKQRKSRQLDSV